MILDELLEKRGLTFDKLSADEKKQYISWLQVLESKPISVEEVKTHIKQLKDAVEAELVDCDEFIYVLFFKIVNRKHVGLKARLKNYLLLEAFLESKERAKKVLERQIEGMMEQKTNSI